MANPFEWLFRRLGLMNETRQLSYLCHAFQQTKDQYDSSKDLPPFMMRRNDDSLSDQMRRENPASYDDRVFAPDFSTILLAELALQADMRNVRIHTGSEADRITRQAGADAVASGQNIYFREGMYQPDSEEGKNLLIHEMQHVAQYQKGKTPDFVEDGEEMEYEATKKEIAVSGRDLHRLERSELSDEKGRSSSERESGMDGASSDLRDFGKKKTEYIRVIGRTGKTYLITKEEREEVVRLATEMVEERLAAEWTYMGERRKKRIMSNLCEKRGRLA